MKRKIIGHRGVAGLELENSAAGFKRASTFDLSAVEMDVRLTKDKKLVVCHDADLRKIANSRARVNELTLNELQKIPLKDGSHVLELHEALGLVPDMPVILDVQDYGCARLLLEEVKQFPKQDIRIASRSLEDLSLLRDLAPKLFLYKVEFTKPIESIHYARLHKLNGVGMYFWLLNPVTYWYARRSKLAIYVFTVDGRFLVSLLQWLYPELAICTNHPEYFTKKRRKLAKK